jgi:glutaredoxin-related protein
MTYTLFPSIVSNFGFQKGANTSIKCGFRNAVVQYLEAYIGF